MGYGAHNEITPFNQDHCLPNASSSSLPSLKFLSFINRCLFGRWAGLWRSMSVSRQRGSFNGLLNRTDTSHIFSFTGPLPLEALSLYQDPKLEHGCLSPESARYVNLCVSYSMQRSFRKNFELGKLSLYPSYSRATLLWWHGNELTRVFTLGSIPNEWVLECWPYSNRCIVDIWLVGLRGVCVLRVAFFWASCDAIVSWPVVRRLVSLASGVLGTYECSPSWVWERRGRTFLGNIIVCYCVNLLGSFQDRDEFSLVRRTLWDWISIVSKPVLLHCFEEALFTLRQSLSPPAVIFRFATVRQILHICCLLPLRDHTIFPMQWSTSLTGLAWRVLICFPHPSLSFSPLFPTE